MKLNKQTKIIGISILFIIFTILLLSIVGGNSPIDTPSSSKSKVTCDVTIDTRLAGFGDAYIKDYDCQITPCRFAFNVAPLSVFKEEGQVSLEFDDKIDISSYSVRFSEQTYTLSVCTEDDFGIIRLSNQDGDTLEKVNVGGNI